MVRRRNRLTKYLGYLLLLPFVPMVVIAGLFLWIDPNDYKPQLIEAMRAATGRELTLGGDLRLDLDLPPTLHADKISLSNPPGYSTPDMLTVGQIDAELSWWRLLFGHITVRKLALVRAELALEVNEAGIGNWLIERPEKSTPADVAHSTGPTSAQSAGTTTDSGKRQRSLPRAFIEEVRAGSGRVTFRDARTGRTRLIEVQRLNIASAGPNNPIVASTDIRLDGSVLSLTAQTGSMAGLLAQSGEPPWPVQLGLRIGDIRINAAGTVARPLEYRGYALKFDANVPDLTNIGMLIGRDLPALRDVTATLSVADNDGKPMLSGLIVQAGGGDLGRFIPGLRVSQLEFSASTMDREIGGTMEGKLGSVPVHVSGSSAKLGTLVNQTNAIDRMPIDLQADGAGASVSVKGTMSVGDSISAIDLAVTARIAQLSGLGAALGRDLPMVNDISATARLSDLEGSLARGVLLRDIVAQSPLGDVSGTLRIARGVNGGDRVSVKGDLSSKLIDIDAAQTSWQLMAGAAPEAPVRIADPTAALLRQPRSPLLFSDVPFDADWLRAGDWDMGLTVGEIRSGGASYRDVVGHLILANGAMKLDPFTASLPGGRLQLRAALDGRVPEWPMSLTLHAPGLAVKPVLTVLGLPSDVVGLADLDADLTSAGRSPRAIAASMAGRIGIAMTDGEFDNRLLGMALGDFLRAARMPPDLLVGGLNGRTKVRCLAARLDLTRGPGTLAALALDTSRMQLLGVGGFNLADESLAVRLRTTLRLGGQSVVVPMRLGGTLMAPGLALDSQEATRNAFSQALTAVSRSARPANSPTVAEQPDPASDMCGPALAAARGARPAGS